MIETVIAAGEILILALLLASLLIAASSLWPF
jgi:hypothetical protein